MRILESEPGDAHLLSHCLSGDIIIIKNFAQELGVHQLVNEMVFRAVSRATGQQNVNRLKAAGIDQIHQFVSATQLTDVVKQVERNLSRNLILLMSTMLKNGFAIRHPVWVLRKPMLRIQIPYDKTRGHHEALEHFRKKYAGGRLTPLRPHRDSWYSEPRGCINIWIALSNVCKGNGFSIYPDTYGKELPFEEETGVILEQAVGKPVNFKLSPGDAVLSHGEHLHASELNHTSSTRTMLSLRISVDQPTKMPWRYSRVDFRHPWSFFKLHPLTAILSRTIHTLVPNKKSRKGAFQTVGALTTDDVQICSHNRLQSTSGPIPVENLVAGKPIPVSRNRCVIKLNNGDVYSFDRYCPHQGGDLSLGYLDGQKLICPWHNLPFDIPDGTSPCKTLIGISSRKCSITDGKVVVKPS